ncbi:MAG: ABC transporter permease, partial [Pseudomonadota bacterium]
AWAVPVSLGDSHRGYRVMGTSKAYFEHYKYGRKQALSFQDGKPFEDLFDAVIGAEVARELEYDVGTPLILTHGLGQVGFSDHDDRPFRVVGVLRPTGTPVDRTVHVSVEAITAIHVGWETGARNPLADTITEEMIRSFDLTPRTVTAAFVGLENRATVLRTRRAINTNRSEPLQAIIPGQALAELWETIGVVENILLAISVFVVAVGLVSILTSILSSLNERRREMSILRAAGAQPLYIFTLLLSEAVLLGLIGAVVGVLLVQVLILVAAPILAAQYGIALIGAAPGLTDLITIGVVALVAFLLGSIPALIAMRRSLADGLTVRL